MSPYIKVRVAAAFENEDAGPIPKPERAHHARMLWQALGDDTGSTVVGADETQQGFPRISAWAMQAQQSLPMICTALPSFSCLLFLVVALTKN